MFFLLADYDNRNNTNNDTMLMIMPTLFEKQVNNKL